MKLRWLVVPVALVLLVWGGYTGVRYVIERPPTALVKLVTRSQAPKPLPAGDLAPLTAPEGFTATIFSRDVPGARAMTRDPKGVLLVTLMDAGRVVALPDRNGDGKADEVQTILSDLDLPHGIVVTCSENQCTLYVAETGELVSYAYDADTRAVSGRKVLAEFPSGSGHSTRTLLAHPDGESLLVSVGSSCNVCNEESPLRATVQRFDIKTGKLETVATGLRNTVFMATDPVTGLTWGTDNGRDLIGDDIPPDEVNILAAGKNYGWPICYGNNIHDTDFDDRQYFRDPCADSTPPHIALQAHSAPLGLAFIPEEGWPEDMRNDLLVAYHGSWNRSEPTGYKVVRFDLDSKRNAVGGPVDFLSGFLNSDSTRDAIGRPVGVLAEPGGVVYVTDDRAGAVYRVSRMAEE